MSRACALCDEPCYRMSDDHAQPCALWTDHTGRVVVVHRACKRRVTASKHAGREQPVARKPGPRSA